MLFCTVLCSTVLCCDVMWNSVRASSYCVFVVICDIFSLFCAVLCCSVLCCVVLFRNMLFCVVFAMRAKFCGEHRVLL